MFRIQLTAAILMFTTASVATAQATVAPSPSPPPGKAQWVMRTFTYKQVGDVKIEADVYRPHDARPRPVLAYIHGGALMMGSKKGILPDLMELCRTEGYCLVSANYRLAPQAKLPQIIDDLRDFIKWINQQGPELFRADASRVVVTGNSAGGYLTMMAGLCEPRPQALVAYYGYGDVDGPWYTTPSDFYRKSRPLVSKADAYKGMTADVVTESAAGGLNRGQLYLYFRQNGLWTQEVSGFDPAGEKGTLDPYCPVRNITADYPPIVMLHGTADTDVPCQESLDMAAQLKKAGVRYEMYAIKGAGHGLMGGDRPAADKATARARQFIKETLGPAVAVAPAASPKAIASPGAGATAPRAAAGPEVYQAWPFNAKEAVKRQEDTAQALGVAQELTLDLADMVQMKLLLIPAGKFMMGSSPKAQRLAADINRKFSNGEMNFANEGPQHEVTITRPFYMGSYPVTRGQFAAFMADAKYKTGPERGTGVDGARAKDTSWKNPGFAQADDHPVIAVNWDDATAFCKWASKKTGRSIGLPTEAQWEHAARAGVGTIFLWGDAIQGGSGWLNAYDKSAQGKSGKAKAVFPWNDGFPYTSPVGKFKPNNFGLYDMQGNASQWCADWQDVKYYQNSPKSDPLGAASGPGRNCRGGSWVSQMPRLSARAFYRPQGTMTSIGFRVICTDVGQK